eukprot:jgi/Ulvmu1/431/UM001_0438.1
MAFVRKRTAVGSKVAGPKPVVLPSEKKENAGQDPNVSLVPHKRGVWGSLSTGPKPDEQHAGHDADGSHDGGHSGALTAHAPSAGGPAWGGAGLPERIQAEVAKDSGSNDGSHGGTSTPGRVHGDGRHAHGHLRQWDDYGGRRMHDGHMPPPPPPPPHAGARRSDSEHHPYPPRAPPPPGPPPPGPPPHPASRGVHQGPADHHPNGPPSAMTPHAAQHSRSHPRRDTSDVGKRHPGFSPEGNFTAKLEAMSTRGATHGPPPDGHLPRRVPLDARSGASPARHGHSTARGNAPAQHGSSQPASGDGDKPAEGSIEESGQVQPVQGRSASGLSQDAAAALASAAAAAAAAALQRPLPPTPATAVPSVTAPHAPAQPSDLSGALGAPGRPVQMGTPVMHLVQGQPVPHGMQPLPPGVTVLPMMPGVQQKATSHVMVPNVHPVTMPVTMHMAPGGMMPVMSSHGAPVPGAVYQHMPMAHQQIPHQVPQQAVMHQQVMMVQHPGGATLPSGVRPQQAVMGPVLPQGPQTSMTHQPDLHLPAAVPPSADVRPNQAPAMAREAAPAGMPDASMNRPRSVAPQGAPEARAVQASQVQRGAPATAAMPQPPAAVSQWSRPPITDATSGRGRQDEPQQRGQPLASAEAGPQRLDPAPKRRGGRGEELGRAQAPGRGMTSAGKAGRRPEAEVSPADHAQNKPERYKRGRGRRDGVSGVEAPTEPVGHKHVTGQPSELPAEGDGNDAGRGRGRGWGRGAGRGPGRGGRAEPHVEELHAAGSSAEQGRAGDGTRSIADAVPGRGAKQPGRGPGRRGTNGRESGRGPEPADRNGLSRGDRAVNTGVAAPPPDAARGHDASNGFPVRAGGPGRGRRGADTPRSVGRGAGRHGEGGQARRKDGGDTAVNVESAAAAAQAAAAAASASAEIAPQVFTQALAKVEAMKIPELPHVTTPSESKGKELRRVSKSRKSRGRHAANVDGHTGETKQ